MPGGTDRAAPARALRQPRQRQRRAHEEADEVFEPIAATRRHRHVGVQAEALEPGAARPRGGGVGRRAEAAHRRPGARTERHPPLQRRLRRERVAAGLRVRPPAGTRQQPPDAPVQPREQRRDVGVGGRRQPDRPRRAIAKVEHHLGELFPRVGFIVTTLTGTNRAVVRFYNQRGTAEQWIKEGKTATHWTRLSCHRFRANEVRLLLGVIAYNLGNLLRRLVLPVAIQDWSLTSLQQRLFKTGGRLIRHARYFTLQLAESYLTGSLFRQILQRIERLAWHPT